MRAILLARATATSMRGFLASIRPSQVSGEAPLRAAAFVAELAPMISRRRSVRSPIFETLPILDTLREADGPLTSEQITDLWLAARGLRVNDQTKIVMRRRIGAGLISYRARGILRNEGEIGGFKGWVVS